MKQQDTKKNILQSAFEFTSKFGLEALSIGELAKIVGMSKSGLFGHFKSKETLQILVLDYAAENFTHKIIIPALKKPRGLARLNAMMDNWKVWSSQYLPGGCPFISAVVEFDDRPGKVREHIKKIQGQMLGSLARAFELAKAEGEISKDADSMQLAYELYGNMLSYHIFNRLLKDPDASKRFDLMFLKIKQESALKQLS